MGDEHTILGFNQPLRSTQILTLNRMETEYQTRVWGRVLWLGKGDCMSVVTLAVLQTCGIYPSTGSMAKEMCGLPMLMQKYVAPCQKRKLNREDAMDRCRWRKLIKDG